MIDVVRFAGADAARHLDDAARLRIEVFREWPYLYDGDLDYERDYLAAFAAAPNACLVVARDGDLVVGVSTAMPLSAADPAIRAPFEEAGEDVDRIMYFGESVLDPSYRGRGVGKRFFDEREAHARRCGAAEAAFCAVVRPADHPARPEGYRPLSGFWRARGYAPAENRVCRLSWKDVGEPEATAKPLQFWRRKL